MTSTTARPQTTSTRAIAESLAAILRAEAAEAHAQWPQYVGHWDGWRVAEVTQRVVSAGRRVAFEAGELVLVAPTTRHEPTPPRGQTLLPYDEWPLVEYATAYSRTNKIDTGVRAEWIREIKIVD